MRNPLEIILFGSPELRLHGLPVSCFRSSKAQALLYYLAVTGRPHARLTLAGLLWGDQPETSARVSLNTCLSNLRILVGDALLIDRQNVAFNHEHLALLDTERFTAAIALAPTAETVPNLQSALALYRGDFLEGFYVRNAPNFEQWLLLQRAQYREADLHGLYVLASFMEQQGDLAAAILYTRRLLAMEPWREEAHRHLMIWLARSGQRAAALIQYESCCQILANELGVEPDVETMATVEAIRRGAFEQGTKRHDDKAKQEKKVEPSLHALTLPVVDSTLNNRSENRPEYSIQLRNNLPQPLTAFVGRASEVALLIQQLRDPACRLLTLAGPGGIGKSRLAIEVAQSLLATEQPFADGLFFVSLLELKAPQQIGAAIAMVFGLSLESEEEIHNQLQNYLRDKRLLLLLDNFEHLHAGVNEVTKLLEHAPQVKLLVTSRTALGIPGEWFCLVTGLELPGAEVVKPEELTLYDSVRLFQQCAQQASPLFNLREEAGHVAHICRLVDGMPLALELAAAWLRLLPCARVVQTFEYRLESLASPLPNAPLRHRSMHAVLSHSWEMLTEHEAEVMEILATFCAGFDDDAALEVAEADLLTLAALTQKSMIRLKQETPTLTTGRPRYALHEMLRQFADAQAAERPTLRAHALQRHSQYYLRWLYHLTPHLLASGQQEAMALVEQDFDNVRAAWQWATLHQDFANLALALGGLYNFCYIRGRALDGVLLLKGSAERLQAQGTHNADGNSEQRHLLGLMLAYSGALYADTANAEEAILLLEQSLQTLDEPRTRAFALGRLGYALTFRGNTPLAEAHLRQSLTFSRACGELSDQAYALFRLGSIACGAGDYRKSIALHHESLAIYRSIQRPDRIAHLLTDLGFTEYMVGEYEAAAARMEESLVICRTLGYRGNEA